MSEEQKIAFNKVTEGLDPSLKEAYAHVASKCVDDEYKFNVWIEFLRDLKNEAEDHRRG